MRRSLPQRRLLALLVGLGAWLAAGHTLSAAPGQGVQARISLSEHDITLTELLKRVGREAGLEYTIHPDAEWQHVAVFAAGMTVKELHAALRQTLMWDITRAKDSATRFRAAPSLRRAALAREHFQFYEESYRSDLDAALQLAAQEREQPGVWEKVVGKKYGLAIGSHRDLFQFLGGLPHAVLPKVLKGEKLRFPFNALNPSLRGSLMRAYQAADPNVALNYGSPLEVELTLVRDVNGVPQHLDVTYQFAGPGQRVHLYTAHRSTLAGLTGREPVPDRLAQPGLDAEDLKTLQATVGKAPPLAADKLPRTAAELSVSLLDLHRRTGYNVLADVYPHWMSGGGEPTGAPAPRPVMIEGLTIERAIVAIGETQGYSCAVRGRSVHFRNWHWAFRSALEKVHHPKAGAADAAQGAASCCH